MAVLAEAALPYREPGIVIILILVSFVVLLNLANYVVDKILYCGLLAQIFLGIAWGTPGGDWLGRDFEHAVVNLGYLGLLLIVYEGGLLTSFKALMDNLLLSAGVAITGIGVPIALSYVLVSLVGATALQAFTAGAALCSTSLGTTFSVLSASSLNTTRMGTILTSAAMMDDVVGLVMVQVISNLGTTSSAFTAADVVRPALVSLAFVVVVPLAARFVAKPLTLWLNNRRTDAPHSQLERVLSLPTVSLIMHTTILVGLVTVAVYAGTSGLFAAYLAGASISWWDTELPHREPRGPPSTLSSGHDMSIQAISSPLSSVTEPHRTSQASQASTPSWTGVGTFESYFAQPLHRILKPFFFASIGFSVPITRMFTGEALWKGIIYTILMFIAKFACGFWLMRLPGLPTRAVPIGNSKSKSLRRSEKAATLKISAIHTAVQGASDPASVSSSAEPAPNTTNRTDAPPQNNEACPLSKSQDPKSKKQKATEETSLKPLSLYPGCILGCAMVARGEIGFLISAIAESNGIYGNEPSGPIFLVVTWAIMLCTIAGPLLVGTLVRRVRRFEHESDGVRGGALGIWGVN